MKRGNFKRAISTFALTACLLMSNAVPGVVIAAEKGGNGYPQDIRTFAQIEKAYPDGFAGKIVVIQSNDSHGDIDDFKYVKPLETYFTDNNAQVLTVDCGDYSQTRSGTKIVEKSEGISALKIMESAGYDVIALGNHEFDYFHEDEKGNNLLQERLDTVKIDALCANIIDKDTNKRVAKQHNCVKTVKVPKTNTSVNIGFFGVDTGETSDSGHASSDYAKDLNVYTGDKLVDCAKKEIADLKNTGEELDNEKNPTADIVICLAHLGVDEARMNKDSSTLLYNGLKKANVNVDVILDANSHTVMTSDKNNAPIMSTGKQFENIGIVVIDVPEGKKPAVVDRFLIPQKEFRKLTADSKTAQTIADAKSGKFDSLKPVYYDKNGNAVKDPKNTKSSGSGNKSGNNKNSNKKNNNNKGKNKKNR